MKNKRLSAQELSCGHVQEFDLNTYKTIQLYKEHNVYQVLTILRGQGCTLSSNLDSFYTLREAQAEFTKLKIKG